MFERVKAVITGVFLAGVMLGSLLGPVAALAQTKPATLVPTNAKFTSIKTSTIAAGSCGATTALIPFDFCTAIVGGDKFIVENTDTSASSFEQLTVKNGTTVINFGTVNQNAAGGFEGAGRSFFEVSNLSGSGIDFGGPHATSNWRFSAGGETTAQVRATIDINGLTMSNGTSIIPSSATVAVANVGANSCGTTAATIVGGNNDAVITVGATSGTQCRVTFTLAATTAWDCTASDNTSTIATRTTPVDTTHTDVFGAFVAGDKVTMICFPR
jgi:hypothetical protein